MSAHSESRGTLYLVPTPLDFGVAQATPVAPSERLPARRWAPPGA